MSKTNTPAPTRSSSSVELKVSKLPNESLVYTNFAYISTEDAKSLSARVSTEATPLTQGNYLKVKNFVFTFQDHKGLEKGTIGFSNPQRRCLEVSLSEPVSCKLFKPKKSNIFLSSLKLEVDLLAAKTTGSPPVFEAKKLEEIVRRNFTNQFFTVGQKFVCDVNSVNVMFTVLEVQVVDLEQLSGSKKEEKKDAKSKRTTKRGLLVQQSELEFAQAGTGTVKITGNPNAAVAIFRPDFNFEKMGIGGLDKEIADIFRRAFASRVFPREFVTKLGIKHVKGK
jgi:vesicle-fusing ATPase